MVLSAIIAFQTVEEGEENVVWNVRGEMFVSNFSELMSSKCTNGSVRSGTRKKNRQIVEKGWRIGETSDRGHEGEWRFSSWSTSRRRKEMKVAQERGIEGGAAARSRVRKSHQLRSISMSLKL